ncbi:hypothetical protein CDCA_CDCA09G2613 [Cyanidium caldarium]|uniref:Trehalase n=1 Tax=Cyanidium caldarium TaxID=2771 RepID=A0AAV9IWX1_CYACA|nr:hypothetical protein CDCA_CDCA09G2613 [Cyanidium caldarium]
MFRLGSLADEFPSTTIYCAANCAQRRSGCGKSLLSVVQRIGVFDDSKQFVDLPLLSGRTPERILDYWDNEFGRVVQEEELQITEDGSVLSDDPDVSEKMVRAGGGPLNDLEEVRKFLLENFDFSPGGDTLPWKPDDLPSPRESFGNGAEAASDGHPPATRCERLLRALPHPLAQWVQALLRLWGTLGRQTSPAVLDEPQRYSLLPMRYPFIVAGGRFRECYYWDTYFIVRGLLICDMWKTARGCVENLLDMVERFGFVPNGARVYYLNRSQPPFLSEMVMALVETAPADVDLAALLDRALPLLEREYAFFMNHRLVEMGRGATLNRYHAPSADGPRPESFREDWQLAEECGMMVRGDPRREELFVAITAAAESGWDFSSRWCRDRKSLGTIRTHKVVPVCLNSVLLRYELNLARLHALRAAMTSGSSRPPLPSTHALLQAPAAAAAAAAETSAATTALPHTTTAYLEAARTRAQTMQTYLYHEAHGQWFDFDAESNMPTLRTAGGVQRCVCASNFFPLWAGALDVLPDADAQRLADRAVQTMRECGLVGRAGVAATLVDDSGLQWDYPNVWPPVQLLWLEALQQIAQRWAGQVVAFQAAKLRTQIVTAFLNTVYAGWRKTGIMYERYDVREPGMPGVGGEYNTQTGFGWTNGVVLVLLEAFAPHLSVSKEDEIQTGSAERSSSHSPDA